MGCDGYNLSYLIWCNIMNKKIRESKMKIRKRILHELCEYNMDEKMTNYLLNKNRFILKESIDK